MIVISSRRPELYTIFRKHRMPLLCHLLRSSGAGRTSLLIREDGRTVTMTTRMKENLPQRMSPDLHRNRPRLNTNCGNGCLPNLHRSKQGDRLFRRRRLPSHHPYRHLHHSIRLSRPLSHLKTRIGIAVRPKVAISNLCWHRNHNNRSHPHSTRSRPWRATSDLRIRLTRTVTRILHCQ